MPKIFDIVNAQNIASYYNEAASNRIPYLGETLFPAKKQLGLDLSWIKGANGLPVALMPSQFDVKATVRDRIGFDKVETEMPFFRESMRIGEKDRQELNKLAQSSNDQMINAVVNTIFDDRTTLINGAMVQPERMRMQLLSTGEIDISANRVDYTYDYGMKADHKEDLVGTAMWSDVANSTPIQDIIGWQDIVEENTGERPTRAVLTRKTWGYLMVNESIKKDMNVTSGQNIILTDSMLRQYLEAKTGVSFAVYNKKYVDEAGVTKNFYPDDHITLIPGAGMLGSTFYGTTPEESDLMAGSDAQVSIVNTGVAVTTYKEPHPVNVVTVVSEIVLPSFENLDKIFIAKVAG